VFPELSITAGIFKLEGVLLKTIPPPNVSAHFLDKKYLTSAPIIFTALLLLTSTALNEGSPEIAEPLLIPKPLDKKDPLPKLIPTVKFFLVGL